MIIIRSAFRLSSLPGNTISGLTDAAAGDDQAMIRSLITMLVWNFINMLIWNLVVVLAVVVLW